MQFFKKIPLGAETFKSSISYATPSNLTYFWNFGLLALFFFAIQIISGLFLAMHYIPSIDMAFHSVEHIMRDVAFGWLFRYLHANGASFFFIVVYLHMFRGLYYASYSIHGSRYLLWAIGVIIFFLMIIIAFLGYVLPWGQMSYWGATVITNLVSTIPGIGERLVTLLWGGYFVSQPALNRFFVFHFFLPFILLGLFFLHILLLHEYHSSNPLRLNFTVDQISFYPYYIYKDLIGFLVVLLLYLIFVFFFPNALSHAINYMEANPSRTPPHIVPEWYFLPFYAILRCIPNKFGGVLYLMFSIFILLLFTFAESEENLIYQNSTAFRILFWQFVADCCLLGYLGAMPAEEPYVSLALLCSVNYFAYFLLITNLDYLLKYIKKN
jgi:quinol-cytochrome oxidoreductase complex cytochrome b subunit